jgi:hypothetical protein
MGVVMIKCPETGRAVSTGIEIEHDSFAMLPDVSAGMQCSACGGYHVWRKADAWLDDRRSGADDKEAGR